MKTILFIFVSNLIWSQNIYVKDIETKETIAYSTISYKFNDEVIYYDYTNVEGFLTLNKSINYNSIEISCLGFENQSINKELISETIFLKPKIQLLKEVIVNNIRKTKVIGFLNEKEKLEIGFSKGLEICMFFENKNKNEVLINSFLFELNQKFKAKHAVRLHIYEISNMTFEPGAEILNENIVFVFDLKNKQKIEIDLSKHSIYLPEKGAFIGIEFLGYFDNDSSFNKEDSNSIKIKFNDVENTYLTFIRNYVKKEKWINTSKLKEDFKNIIKFKNTPNASFGLKIYEE